MLNQNRPNTSTQGGDIVLPPFDIRDVANEYTLDDFQALAFPNLFPYGRGSYRPSQERPHLIKRQESYNAFLMEYHDGRFLHPIFMFWTLNILQRKKIAGATVKAAEHAQDEAVCIMYKKFFYF